MLWAQFMLVILMERYLNQWYINAASEATQNLTLLEEGLLRLHHSMGQSSAHSGSSVLGRATQRQARHSSLSFHTKRHTGGMNQSPTYKHQVTIQTALSILPGFPLLLQKDQGLAASLYLSVLCVYLGYSRKPEIVPGITFQQAYVYSTVYTYSLRSQQHPFNSVAHTQASAAVSAAQEYSAWCPSATPEENRLPTDPCGSILAMYINT